jgi:UDP-2-acetamido-3-amino-2,3-dideoxy-glucuronate N-acetyltransferase
MSSTYIHPQALVECDEIGAGTRIWAFTHVMKGVRIGGHCNIGEHCFFETGARIGNNVTIKNGNMIWDGVTLEDGTFVGPQVLFTNDLYPRSPRLQEAERRYRTSDWLNPTLVERGASVGAGAILLAGIRVGAFAMIGAGTVVTKSVAPHALMIGTPGHRVGSVCQCGQPLYFTQGQAVCVDCGRRFGNHNESIELLAGTR